MLLLVDSLFVLSFFICTTFAIKAVIVPTTINGGSEVQVVLELDAQDVRWEQYRLYLGADDPYRVLWPFCFLSPFRSMNETTTTIKIPRDVGPDGSTYRVHAYTAETFEWSEYVTLTGMALANWSAAEPISMKLMDAVPCTAMDCNRKCAEKNNAAHKDGTWWTSTIYCSCLRRCPGVDTSNPYYGAGDGCGNEWRNEDDASRASVSAATEDTSLSPSLTSIGSFSKPLSAEATITSTSDVPPTTPVPTILTAATPTPSKALAPKLQQLHTGSILVFGIALTLL